MSILLSKNSSFKLPSFMDGVLIYIDCLHTFGGRPTRDLTESDLDYIYCYYYKYIL